MGGGFTFHISQDSNVVVPEISSFESPPAPTPIDYRFQPYFLTPVIGGNKAIILVLGEAGLTDSEFEQSKQTVRNILLSLGPTDLVALFSFTSLLGAASHQFLPATESNVKKFLTWLDGFKSYSRTGSSVPNVRTLLNSMLTLVKKDSGCLTSGSGSGSFAATALLFHSGKTIDGNTGKWINSFLETNKECGQGSGTGGTGAASGKQCLRLKAFSFVSDSTATDTVMNALVKEDSEVFGNIDLGEGIDLVGFF